MFKIKIEKEFDGTTANFDVTTKEEFVNALGEMWDIMAKEIEDKDKTFDFLEGTEFESKEDFLEWFRLMKRKGIATPGFDYDEFCAEITDETISSMTDYHDLDNMTEALDEMKSAMCDVQDILNRWV